MAEKASQPKTDWSAFVRDIVAHLNEKAGTAYRPSASSTKRPIEARLNEGYDPRDCFDVIDEKCRQWLGDDIYSRYLRPYTLFGSKFAGYLEEARRRQKHEAKERPVTGRSGAGFRKGLLDD